jgi:calcium-dependent protein kinase
MAFDFFDKDKSGKLSPDEVRAALGIGSNKKDNELIKEIIAEVDLNNDGLISFDEFKHLMVKICSKK